MEQPFLQNLGANGDLIHGFQAKILKCQSEVQTALARKLTEGGK